MYHLWWNGQSWGGWEDLGGNLAGSPSCVSWGPNRIDCLARNTSDTMIHRWSDGQSWGGWEYLGGVPDLIGQSVIRGVPNCVSWGPNRIDCFIRGPDDRMYHRWWNGQWNAPR